MVVVVFANVVFFLVAVAVSLIAFIPAITAIIPAVTNAYVAQWAIKYPNHDPTTLAGYRTYNPVFLNGDLEGTALSEDLVLAFGTYAGKGGLSLHSVTGNNIRAALSLPGSADVPFVLFDFASMSVRTGAQSVATAETLLLPPTLPRPLSKALAWTRRLALGYTPMVAGGAQSVAAAEMRLLPSTVSVQH